MLGDLAEYVNGAAFKPTDWSADGTPIIRIQNLTNPKKPLNLTRRTVDPRLLIKRGNILFSWSATLDAFIWEREPAWLNQHIFKVVPKLDKVDPEFLYHLLKFEVSALIGSEHLHGTTMRHINRGPFLAHRVWVPPLAEQRCIVAWIENFLARIRSARADLKRIGPLAQLHRTLLLKKAFAGELTADYRSGAQTAGSDFVGPYDIPRGWSWCLLPRLGNLARGKSRHRPRNDHSLYGGSYPFIQTGDIRAANGRVTRSTQTYNEVGLAQSRVWPGGTVCITIAANIAETAILDMPACFPDSIVGFIADKSKCSPEYVELFLRTAKADLSAFAPATAQKNINLETLKQVLVPVAPLPEQNEITHRVQRSLAAVERVEHEAARALALLDQLSQIMLAKAFCGELVTRNVVNGPIEVVLAGNP